MSLTTESKKTIRGLSLEKRCWFSPKWNTVQSLVISRVVDLGFQFGLYG
jgi:hypothetical protein